VRAKSLVPPTGLPDQRPGDKRLEAREDGRRNQVTRALVLGAPTKGDDTMELLEDGFCARNSGRPDLFPHAMRSDPGWSVGRIDEVTALPASDAQPEPLPSAVPALASVSAVTS